MTKIAWVKNPDGTLGLTWNPWTGCTKVSEGCKHCYAEALTLRYKWGPAFTARDHKVVLHPERLTIPLRVRKPTTFFVCSMSDLFHEEVPMDYIHVLCQVMDATPQHTYQILTKRPERARAILEQVRVWPLPNVWLGVSVEKQKWAARRISPLRAIPVNNRFVSCEPLLGPVDFRLYQDLEVIDWVIVGGESGPKHRPMKMAWLEDIVGQCREAGVPVFVKQDSGLYPGRQGRIPRELWIQEMPGFE